MKQWKKYKQEKDLNITELDNLIYAAAVTITEEINGRGNHKSEIQESKNTLMGQTNTGEYKWYQEKTVSFGGGGGGGAPKKAPHKKKKF
jgi:hypothetical protein